jgi:hypothetical protein
MFKGSEIQTQNYFENCFENNFQKSQRQCLISFATIQKKKQIIEIN